MTFAPGTPPRGSVGFVAQSGALGLAMIDLASDRNLGISSFASIGNRADITANDFLEYWEGTTTNASRCCTSSPSAIRAASRGSLGGSGAGSRSWW